MAENQPMRPIEFLVLASLTREELHGYGIVQEIEARTSGRIQVKPGNLYRVLDRLLERGLLEEAEQRPAADLDDQRRRYYRITDAGQQSLAAEARMLGAVIDGVRREVDQTAG